MGSLPLHPAIVHFPIALSILLPLFAIGAGVLAWRGQPSSRPWLIVPMLALLLVASGLAAMSAGEDDAEKVEKVAPESAVHEHEEWAESLIWTASGTLLLALFGLAPNPTLRRGAMVATMAASVAVAGLALKTGEEGGKLVYEHCAPAAHGAQCTPSPGDKDGATSVAHADDDD